MTAVEHNAKLAAAWLATQGEYVPLLDVPCPIIELPNVTLWASVPCGGENYQARVFRVLRYCNRLVKFQRTVLISCVEPRQPFEFEFVRVPQIKREELNIWFNCTAPKYLLESDFSFSVHEDGFILNPSLWTPEFLACDYIGAPWDARVTGAGGMVGNGAFCIESRRMNEEKLILPMDAGIPPVAADVYVCRTHRERLEKNGIRFAPVELAERFSVELTGRDKPSFGFHGKTVAKAHYKAGWEKIKAHEKEERKGRSISVELFYIYVGTTAQVEGATPASYYQQFTKRFRDTYREFRSGDQARLTVISGNDEPDTYAMELFAGLASFKTYLGTGWDIGAHQEITRQSKADFVVCFNSTTYFHRDGWLERLMDAYREFGEGLYGATGSNESHPHIRTACF
mgnify:FL=1